MTKTHLALNDIMDAIEELTRIVEELNPGANEQIRRVRFLVKNADENVRAAIMAAGEL